MSDVIASVEISRKDFVRAVKNVARGLAKQETVAGIRFEGNSLHIESSNVVAEVPADGVWPEKVFVEAAFVRRLAQRTPPGDPIHLTVSDGRIHVNRYSEPCANSLREEQPQRARAGIDVPGLVAKAAAVIKPLHVSPDDLKMLADETMARGLAQWRAEDKKMISLVRRAWELLAPLGVETTDIRRLVDQSVRNAWRSSK